MKIVHRDLRLHNIMVARCVKEDKKIKTETVIGVLKQ